HQALQRFAPPFGLQIERDRALVRALGEEARAHALLVERVIAAAFAALVGLVRVLHLDHVSAQHGELIGGEWPREDVGAVEYLHSFEWAHGWSPVGGVRLVDLYVGILHDLRVLRDLRAYIGGELARRAADRLDGVAREHAAEIGLRE